MALTKDNMYQKRDNNHTTYSCATPDCSNILHWDDEKQASFIRNNWVDKDGNPTKPRYCRECRYRRRVNQQ